MARRKKDVIPKNDFATEEESDVCSFSSSSTIDGDCVNLFHQLHLSMKFLIIEELL